MSIYQIGDGDRAAPSTSKGSKSRRSTLEPKIKFEIKSETEVFKMSSFNEHAKLEEPDLVTAVSLGQNGEHIAIGTEQGHLILVNTQTGESLKTYKAHQSKIT